MEVGHPDLPLPLSAANKNVAGRMLPQHFLPMPAKASQLHFRLPLKAQEPDQHTKKRKEAAASDLESRSKI